MGLAITVGLINVPLAAAQSGFRPTPISVARLGGCTDSENIGNIDLSSYTAAVNAGNPLAAANALAAITTGATNLASPPKLSIVLDSRTNVVATNVAGSVLGIGIGAASVLDNQALINLVIGVTDLRFGVFGKAEDSEAGAVLYAINSSKANLVAARVLAALGLPHGVADRVSIQDAAAGFDAAAALGAAQQSANTSRPRLLEVFCAAFASGGWPAIEAFSSPPSPTLDELRTRIYGDPELPDRAAVSPTWTVVSDQGERLAKLNSLVGQPDLTPIFNANSVGRLRRTRWTAPSGATVDGVAIRIRAAEDRRPCDLLFNLFSARAATRLDQVPGYLLIVEAPNLPVTAALCTTGSVRIASAPTRELALAGVATGAQPPADPAPTTTSSATTATASARSTPTTKAVPKATPAKKPTPAKKSVKNTKATKT